MRPSLHAGPTRHQRAWLATDWLGRLRSAISADARATLDDWFGRGLPAEVTQSAPEDARLVSLAVTLPAARWLARIEILVERAAVERLAPPPLLADACTRAPAAWIPPLGDLSRTALDAGVPLSVTGALAWQFATGETYVGASTPVDLLFQPRTREALDRMLEILRAREGWSGPRLAGEVVLGWNDQVSWRDILQGRRRVLVRGTGREVVAEVAPLLAALR